MYLVKIWRGCRRRYLKMISIFCKCGFSKLRILQITTFACKPLLLSIGLPIFKDQSWCMSFVNCIWFGTISGWAQIYTALFVPKKIPPKKRNKTRVWNSLGGQLVILKIEIEDNFFIHSIATVKLGPSYQNQTQIKQSATPSRSCAWAYHILHKNGPTQDS